MAGKAKGVRCEQCNRGFVAWIIGNRKPKRFCSDRCRVKSYYKPKLPAVPTEMQATCAWCKERFTYIRRSKKPNAYCGSTCRKRAENKRRRTRKRERERSFQPKTCIVCHVEFIPKRKDAGVCSPECRKRKWREFYRNRADAGLCRTCGQPITKQGWGERGWGEG